MSKRPVKVKLNLRGLNQIMRGPEIQAVMQGKGEQIRSAAEQMSGGGKFEAETKPYTYIAKTYVRVKDYKALKSVYEDNTLLKALGSSKGE